MSGTVDFTARDSSGLTRKFTIVGSSFPRQALSGRYEDLEGRPLLARAATSGSYLDLDDRPFALHGQASATVEAGQPEAAVTVAYPQQRRPFFVHAQVLPSGLHRHVHAYVREQTPTHTTFDLVPRQGAFACPDVVCLKWLVTD